ncbi:MAG: glutamine--fructose-6-phosphate transaminase (isomerizing) [Candidatus Hermodarchaeota archaeon]
MCGIVGIVSLHRNDIGRILIECGHRLTYRGYDSVGIAAKKDGVFTLKKDAGTIDEVDAKLGLHKMEGNLGLLQLRWATYGKASMVNAQPHYGSEEGKYVGCHNGNILNTHILNKQFREEGLIVRSDNDGEVCVHATERYLLQGYGYVEALAKAYHDLKGHFAFEITGADTEKIYVLKKGVSLVIGLGENENYVSSDLPSLLPLTKKIIHIKDGEIAEVSATSVRLFRVRDCSEIHREPELVKMEADVTDKRGFSHFMLKEIHQQATAIRDMFENLRETGSFVQAVEALSKAKKIFFVGCGTSYHALLGGVCYFNKYARTAVIPAIAGLFLSQYGESLDEETVVVLVSQSGETKDVINVLNYCKEKKIGKIIALTNVIGSTIMRAADINLALNSGFEVSVPATKTYTNQLGLFVWLALALGRTKDILSDENYQEFEDALIDALPGLIEETIRKTTFPCLALAKTLVDIQDTYILGLGFTYGPALEGALKFKEITYIHSEGMLSTEFKHGSLSAVTENYPMFFVVSPENHWEILQHINESKCRGARIIVISELDEKLAKEADYQILLPTLSKEKRFLTPVLSVIPLQLISYYTSIERDIDPDHPRNLSKTLTVD